MSREKLLTDRHKSEKDFHDKNAVSNNNKSFYDQGAEINSFKKLIDIAGDMENKKLMDFGCGNGWASIVYARKGALVTGLDISHDRLIKGRDLVIKESLQDRLNFVQGSGEGIPFKDRFDLIIGISILHHLDLELVVKSLKSVLKKDGRAIFFEPMAHNPFIQLFRRLTPDRRTKDESPINIDFINSLRSEFAEVNFYGSQFLSLFSFIFFIMKAYRTFRKSNDLLCKVDEVLFKLLPGVQKYCWGGIIELKK